MTYPIKELFCWIVDDPDQVHGIMGVQADDEHAPMQAVSSKWANMVRPGVLLAASTVATETGLRVRLVRFSQAEVMVEVQPQGTRKSS